MALEPINPNKVSNKVTDSDGSGKVRPRAAPRSETSFRKVLKDTDPDDSKEVEIEEEDDVDEKTTLFKLSSTSTKKQVTSPIIAKTPMFDEAGVEINPDGLEFLAGEGEMTPEPKMEDIISPSAEQPVAAEQPVEKAPTDIIKPKPDDLVAKPGASTQEAGRMATAMNVNKKGKAEGDVATETGTSEVDSKKTKVASKTAKEGSEENPDLAAINANRQTVNLHTTKSEILEESTSQSSIRDLAARIIEKIQTMRSEGKTDTIVTLRNPPMLEGSTMTLTALDGAKREFNISFTNLSDAGKMFLDRKLTEDNLTQILDRKGIVVHTLTTTTLVEIPISTDADNQLARDQQREQQEQQRQRRPQNFEEEESA
jgi:hypothetical protein